MTCSQALEEIKRMDKPFITPKQAARVIGCDPAYIRLTARGSNPSELGFPTTVMRSKTDATRTKTLVPRIPFIRYVEEGYTSWL